MINKICLIYNYAQHYRKGIFVKMDKEMDVDFYFGDKMDDVKKMDYSELNSFKKELKNRKLFSHFYWQSGVLSLFFLNYKKYIVLGEYYCLSTWMLLLLVKLSNKKVYLWTHGWYGNEKYLKKTIKKIFFKLSDGIFLYGDYAKKLMINEGFNENKLHVIYNSLDYDTQLNIRAKLTENKIYKEHFKNDNPTIIFIGRITKVKKLHWLIEVQKKLKEKNVFINLVFIGEGEEKKSLEIQAKQEKINDIWFYGSSYNEDEIGNLVYNATICVSPGNVGLTAMHTMVYGTPVITHNNFSEQMPEFEAIEENVTGAFYVNKDLISLSVTLENWLLNNTDRQFTRNKCFEKIDNYFNPEYQIKIIKNVLSNEKL
jgi:glycosyltransferase involved in cell wall biosynthesis